MHFVKIVRISSIFFAYIAKTLTSISYLKNNKFYLYLIIVLDKKMYLGHTFMN